MWCLFVFLIFFSKIADSENIFIRMKAYRGYASQCNSTLDCKFISLQCIHNMCLCAADYEFDKHDGTCVLSSPTLGDPCDDICYPSDIQCINNYCEMCFDTSEGLRCSNHMQNQHMLLTATQIALTALLILGILAVLILFWKLCSKSSYRQQASRRRGNSTARGRISTTSNGSASSLQRAVTERLRDAPPPYSRASIAVPPPGDTPPPYHLHPDNGYVNASFEMECNIPPPAYSSIVSQIEVMEYELTKIDTGPSDIEPKGDETMPASAVLHM